MDVRFSRTFIAPPSYIHRIPWYLQCVPLTAPAHAYRALCHSNEPTAVDLQKDISRLKSQLFSRLK